MIRSSKVSLKFLNKAKAKQLENFCIEYRKIVSQIVDILWDMNKIPRLMDKSITKNIKTDLSSIVVQCAGKQASSIVRSILSKKKKREYVVSLCEKINKKKAIYLIKKNLMEKTSKPDLKNINIELDCRLVDIGLENNTSFDGWLTIKNIGNRKKFYIPFKKHRHFNKLFCLGSIKKCATITNKDIIFSFEINVKKNTSNKILGIDIGKKTLFSCSNGNHSDEKKDVHCYNKIIEKMMKKKYGSKKYKQAQDERKNCINYQIKKLNIKRFGQINIENLKNVGGSKRRPKIMSVWSYREILNALEMKCEECGVHILKVNPAYTSRRCSKCGWTEKRNRNGKIFKCLKCGFKKDSDINAAINISLSLPCKEKWKFQNKDKFYWSFEK